jgi:hypothetical protein
MDAKFGFYKEHLWRFVNSVPAIAIRTDGSRNFGVLIALIALFSTIYLLSSEFVTMLPPRSDILLFQRKHVPAATHQRDDEETAFVTHGNADKLEDKNDGTSTGILEVTKGAHFVWSGLTYDIKVGKRNKRILNDIHGWVKPGTLTALMVRISSWQNNPPSYRTEACTKLI